jgi:multidrug efflux system membrane fusion protein
MPTRRSRYLVAALIVIGGGGYLAAHWSSAATGANAQERPAAAQNAGSSQAGGARRAGGAAAPAAVQTAAAVSQNVPLTRNAIGSIEPTASVVVKPRIDGTITEVHVVEGQMVKQGDVLFRLDDQTIQAAIAKDQAQIAKDQATLDQNRADLARYESLAPKQVVTEQSLQQARNTVKAQEATLAIDNANLRADQVQLGYTTITAPVSGRVGVVGTSTGNVVRAADTSTTGLMTITVMAPLRATFSVPQQDLALYRKAMDSGRDIPVSVLAPDKTTVRATGKLSFVDSAVDTSSGTITVKALFDNADGALWPGEYVNVRTELEQRPDQTVVPIEAVQESEAGQFVYVVQPNQTVARTPVKVAETFGDSAIIASGVKPGDHVVTEGQLRLSNGAPVREASAAGSGAARTQAPQPAAAANGGRS